jgi:hypothetical protein
MSIGIGEIIYILLLVGTVVYGIKALKSLGIGSKQKLMASGVSLLALGLVDFWFGTKLNAGAGKEGPLGYLIELFGILAVLMAIAAIVLVAMSRTQQKKG